MKRLVFVGAGHAHLFPLSETRAFVERGIEVTLIAPGRFWYSGMGPGMISGFYQPADDTVDVQALVERGDSLRKASPGSTRELRLTSWSLRRLRGPFAQCRERGADGDCARRVRVRLAGETDQEFARAPGGFGCRSNECSGPDCHHRRGTGGKRDCRQSRALAGGGKARGERCSDFRGAGNSYRCPPKARRIRAKYRRSIGVACISGARQITASPAKSCSRNTSGWRSINISSPRGFGRRTLLRESGLLCANDGSLRVNDFLQGVTHPEIFGAGDCIHFGERGLPRIGVYAVRQAPILAHNLRAYLAGEALKNFQPQKNYLLILNLGDGSALLTRGRWTIRNRPAFGSRTGSIAGSSGDFKSARGLVRRARLFRR